MVQLSTIIPLHDVKIQDSFWTLYQQRVRDVVLPYQWEALNDRVPDAEPSHAVQNFRIAAGEAQGEFQGFVFQDSDLAKWLETVGYALAVAPDPELERIADDVIDLIGRAQQPNGYLNTYFTIKAPDQRWMNLREAHELYVAGHFIEAAIAYYQATGKRKVLDLFCRLADHIDATFGPELEKLHGYPGHEEIELALVKLYHATGEPRYLKLSQYFINERGQEPYYFEIEAQRPAYPVIWSNKIDRSYFQTHAPVRQQTTAEGHAVRALYLYCGMADVAAATNDASLFAACQRLWENVTTRRMYITGGIGSTVHGEAFTFDYDLPNDTIYAETCASIGLILFAHRMLKLDPDRRYADVLEQALYNTVLSGMALDGTRYFYVNPLEVWPEASAKSPLKKHVKPVRQKWYACACCPPNVARLLMSLGQYVYTVSADTVFAHLYIGGEANLTLNGQSATITQETQYPYAGQVTMTLSLSQETPFTLAVRIPGWCQSARLSVNGDPIELNDAIVRKGYIYLQQIWENGDRITLDLDMPVELQQAHPEVRASAGKIAITRGPLVYCLEECDNGPQLASMTLPANAHLIAEFENDLLGGTVVITGEAFREDAAEWDDQTLYRPVQTKFKRIPIKAIPYYLWCNRTPGEMLVWIRTI